MSKTKKALIITGSVIAVLVITVFAVFENYYSKLDHRGKNASWDSNSMSDADIIDPNASANAEALNKQLAENLAKMQADSSLAKTNTFNVLFIGVDSRQNTFYGNTDSLILISIDKSAKKITMTSLLRDIYVSIPGHGQNRINAAYAFGGEALLKQTIKENLGLDIDRTVVVNFTFSIDFFNKLGGVDLEVNEREIEVINYYLKELNRLAGRPEGTYYLTSQDAGMVHLNGDQTLAHSRDRYVGTDFARTGRQRQIITICLEKIKKMNLVQLNSLADEFLPRIRTDLTRGDCASMLLLAMDVGSYKLDSFAIPVDGTWQDAKIDGKAVEVIDFVKNRKAWYDHVTAK